MVEWEDKKKQRTNEKVKEGQKEKGGDGGGGREGEADARGRTEKEEGDWTFSTEWSLKKRQSHIRDETSEAETAAATPGGKSASERCTVATRNYERR